MGKYLITGRQGTGKTTIIKALQERSYVAYNTDDLPEVTKLQNKLTGEVVEWPEGTVDWSTYSWNWQKEALKKLLDSNDTVFIGGIVSNQATFYPLFDKIFVICIDPETLRQRLNTHEHTTHHLPGEIDRLASIHAEKQKKLTIDTGGVEINGTRPINEIVDDILSRINHTN